MERHPESTAPPAIAPTAPLADAAGSTITPTAWSSCSPWAGLGSLAFMAVIAAALLVSAAPAHAGHDDDRSRFAVSVSVGDHHNGGSIRYEHRSRGWGHHGRSSRGDRGDRGYRRGYGDRDYGYGRDRGYRSRDRYERHDRYPRPRYDRDGYRCDTGYSRPARPHGYWRRTWCPPVYGYRYDDCGNAIRVCIRAGYWKRVYIRYRY